MKCMDGDVREMVGALMTVVSGIERAKRQGEASILSLLYFIAGGEPVRPSALSEQMGVNQSSVTRQVQALLAAGMAAVEADPSDGRSCFVTITDVGRRELERLEEIGLQRFGSFVEDWEPDEVRTLARLLRKLEESKFAVRQRETHSYGRHWQRQRGKG
jgi:DNA-binding MarR family transcriptional regulator